LRRPSVRRNRIRTLSRSIPSDPGFKFNHFPAQSDEFRKKI